ncbi:MAG: cache domain-containing sensor histidine kinase [Bacillota bacterium]
MGDEMNVLVPGRGRRFPHLLFDSLRSKFILSFLVLCLVPMLLLAFFSYRAYLNVLQRNVNSYNSEVIERVARNLEIYLSDLEHILQLRNDYYNLQFIKLSRARDIEGNRRYVFRLWENFNNIRKIKTDLRDIAVTTTEGVTISCYGVSHIDPAEHKLYQILARRSATDMSMALWEPHPFWLGGRVFSVGQAIRDNNGNFLGIMSIDIDLGLLDKICRHVDLSKSGYIMLVDADGRIIYHPDMEKIGGRATALLGRSLPGNRQSTFSTRLEGEDYVITVKAFPPADWFIVSLSNKNELYREMRRVSRIMLALIAAATTAIVLVVILLSRLLTKPLEELQRSMDQAADDLNINVTVRTNDEIGRLGEAFNQMLARIRQLMAQSVQEQKKLRHAEMIALQQQIKPHFIYNTLDLIIGLLETNKNEDVINMVEALGAFFRISLSHGKEFITVREEIEHVRNYLFIQRFRHGDRYNYRFEVDERILENLTLKLILQPLVENAIYHGVRELDRADGLIVVRGYPREDYLCFEVEDNGLGIDSRKVEEINRCLRKTEPAESSHRFFGLYNVNERIVLAFGKEYGLNLISTLGGGTKVTVRLPLIRDETGHDGSRR